MSQTTSAYADPGVQPYQSPGITVETKLMKQFRFASPVHSGSQGAAVCNKAGQVELFTAGTDGTVWNYYPDPSSDTGYRRADTGLKSTLPFAVFAAGVDQDGSVVVFARATPAVLHYRVKKPDGTWSEKVETANLPEGSGFNFITAIVARTIDGQLYVAVLGLESGSPPGSGFLGSYLATSNWSSLMPGLFHWGSYTTGSAVSRFSRAFGTTEQPPGPPSKTVVFTFLCSNKFYTYDLDGNLVDTLRATMEKTFLGGLRRDRGRRFLRRGKRSKYSNAKQSIWSISICEHQSGHFHARPYSG